MTWRYPIVDLLLRFGLCLTLFLSAAARGADTEEPPLLLANVYHDRLELADYWVSEKLDGVRAYWDGTHLVSRNGNIFHAPRWFTEGFPAVPLDGELWMGRGTFAALSGAVRRLEPVDADWRKIRYMVFDLPGSDALFDDRLATLRRHLAGNTSPYLALVEQFRVSGRDELLSHLDRLVAQGAEGLMLHRGSSRYRSGRSDDLLKLKPYQDAEARVVAHIPGRGKYRGLLGSLVVETPEGLRFRVGTGFSDAERRNPPRRGCHHYLQILRQNRKRHPPFCQLSTRAEAGISCALNGSGYRGRSPAGSPAARAWGADPGAPERGSL